MHIQTRLWCWRSRAQNVSHQALNITNPLDKSTLLLSKAITENENLTCTFDFYRTNRSGVNAFFKVKLINARIAKINLNLPHSITNSEGQPEEVVSFTYESITQEHCIAGTSGYSLWSERIF